MVAALFAPPQSRAAEQAGGAASAQATTGATASLDAELPGAPVRLDHRMLFIVRGSSSLPAVTPGDITIVSTPLGEEIMAGGARVMRVLPADYMGDPTEPKVVTKDRWFTPPVGPPDPHA